LRRPEIAGLPWVAHILRHKIRMAKPDNASGFDDAVTGTSYTIWSVDDGPPETGLLSHRARYGNATGVIPVCSSLGAALIGMSVGDRTPYLRADLTICLLKILRTTTLA
tara:strand:+ start:555 stop:881 length:327 start_codon:yes stop_codon:yes gene_type:complete